MEAAAFFEGQKEALIEQARRAADRQENRPAPEELERLAKDRSKLEREEKRRRIAEETREKDRLCREMGVAGIETIVDTGDSAKRLDVVILGDGWAEKDLDEYRRLCKNLAQQFAERVSPFNLYAHYLNFHRVDVIGKESGIPSEKPERTVFGTELDRKGILTSSGSAALPYAQLARDADLTVVMANTATGRSTGGGGHITLVKTGVDGTVIHEMGHALANLADEYSEEAVEKRRSAVRAEEYVNTTLESDPLRVKWHYWNIPEEIFRGRKAPKEGPVPEKRVGTFEGGYYHVKGVWRPKANCRMRDSDVSSFCEVCAEEMEKRFYRFVSPIDEAFPKTFRRIVFSDGQLEFSIRAVHLAAEALERLKGKGPPDVWELGWYVDGQRVAEGKVGRKGEADFTLAGKSLTPGRHTVSCQMNYLTARMRRDAGLLTGGATWEVKVLPFARPEFKIPAKRFSTTAGSPLAFPVACQTEAPSGAVVFEPLDLPEGAAFADGMFTWTPRPDQRGAYEIAFALLEPAPSDTLSGEGLVKSLREEVGSMRRMGPAEVWRHYGRTGGRALLHEESVRIDVKGGRGSSNAGPKMAFGAVPAGGAEGEPIRFTAWAFDPDGDHLLYDAKNLPEGARLDANTGRFEWIPTLSQAGLHKELEIRVTDGVSSDRVVFDLEVADAPLDRQYRQTRSLADLFQDEADIVVGLRHDDENLRLASLDLLGEYPVEMQIREAGRMLRDDAPEVRQAALALLKSLLALDEGVPAPGPGRAGYEVGEGTEEGADAAEGDSEEPATTRAVRFGALFQALTTREGTHTWTFVDDPEVLAWLEEVSAAVRGLKDLRASERKAARRIEKDLKSIGAYNRNRTGKKDGAR